MGLAVGSSEAYAETESSTMLGVLVGLTVVLLCGVGLFAWSLERLLNTNAADPTKRR